MINKTPHIPVLLKEALNALSIKDEEFYIDATFGLGGYTKAILEENNCKVLAIDCDPEAEIIAAQLKKDFKNRFFFINGKFSQIIKFAKSLGIVKVAGVIFDLGVSSPQLDQKNRGFSFRLEGPLDMRMSKEGATAEEFINKVDENTLANIIYELGDEVFSRRIAKNIIRERSLKTISNTVQLASIIRNCIPKKTHKIDPATKTFQAIRIYLNDEISELENGLIAAEQILKPSGVLAAVSFHSIEDRIIKKFFLKSSKNNPISRHLPHANINSHSLKIITKKPILPSSKEILMNKRSRSAKLRVAERTIFPSLYGEVA
ncbi:16S rRNA (cytosine(1402)-N(4))-methyltransferase RsmH [Alphaproteobacteria bacterium]|nr:16S rRNA (cytosine(1402)-N(4))-methyltransferase RsmH [Alphaproteobacteria bacterium]